MSIASAWKYHDVFPFCIEDLDIDSVVTDNLTAATSYIRDLTLAEAMQVYWLLESLTLQIETSGATFGSGDYDANLFFTDDALCVFSPRERVCLSATPPTQFSLTAIAATTGYDYVNSTPISENFEGNLIVAFGLDESFNIRNVTRQNDGKYTVWCDVDIDDGRFFALRGIGSPASGFTEIGSFSLPIVGSSVLPLKLYAFPDYDSGTATVDVFTGSAAYYTVA